MISSHNITHTWSRPGDDQSPEVMIEDMKRIHSSEFQWLEDHAIEYSVRLESEDNLYFFQDYNYVKHNVILEMDEMAMMLFKLRWVGMKD